MGATGGDTADLVAQKFDVIAKAAEGTYGKFEALSSIQDRVQEAWKSGAIDYTDYVAFNNTLAETEAKMNSLQAELDAYREAQAGATAAMDDAQTSILAYKDELADYDSRLSEVNSMLRETAGAINEMSESGDTEPLLKQQLVELDEAVEVTTEKLQMLEEQKDEVQEAFLNGEIEYSDLIEYNHEVETTQASLQSLVDQQTALRDSLSGTAQEEQAAHDAVMDYQNALVSVDAELTANQARLAAIKAERDAGRVTLSQDIESHKLYKETLKETTDKLKDLESRQKEVKQAFENGTISAEEYTEFQGKLGEAAAALQELKQQMGETKGQSDDTGVSIASLGELIKSHLAADAIKAGVSALLDILRELGGEIREIISQTETMGDTVDKQSQRLGMTTEAYQEWRYVLSQNGADISTLTASMRTLTNQVEGLQSGTAKATNTFAKLGLTMEDMQGKTGEEQFSLIIERLQMMDDETQRNALANDLLGRSYMQLIPLLNQSSDSVEQLKQRAHDTNQLMSQEAVDAAVKYHDALDTLNRSFDGFENRIGAELMPGLTEITDGMIDLLNGVDGADEKIEQGVDDLISGAEKALPMIEELIENIAEVAGDKAPEIISKMITKLAEKLPDIANGLANLAAMVVGAIEEALPDIGTAAGSVVVTITSKILELLADPQTLADVLESFVKTGVAFCSAIADGIMHYDWGQFTQNLLSNLADTFDTAQKYVQVWMDNTFSGGSLYNGDVNNVANSEFWEMHRKGAEEVVDYVSGVTEYAAEKYDEGKQTLKEIFDSYDSSTQEDVEAAEEAEENLEEAAEDMEKGSQALSTAVDTAADAKKKLQDYFRDLEITKKENGYSDKWLLDQQKAYLDTLDKSSDLYKEYHNKWLDDLEKYKTQQGKDQKKALQDYYRDLNTIKNDNGFDEGWLLDQQKAYLDTLDKDSELYKEFYDKWAEDKREFDDKIAKAEEKEEDKRRKEKEKRDKKIESERRKLIKEGHKAAEKLLAEYEKGQENIMKAVNKPTEVTDVNGKKHLVFTDFKKKLQEIRAYQRNLDKLEDLHLSEQHMKEIFSMDLETRMQYISELLRMSEGNRQKYLNDYEAYYKAAYDVSKTEVDLSGKDDKILNEGIDKALDDITDNSYIAGKEAREAWLQGWRETGGEFYEDMMPAFDRIDATERPETMVTNTLQKVFGVFADKPLTINVAGTQAIKMTLGQLLTALKNSGGALDV